MNWRAFFALVLSLGLALGFAPAFSQAAPSTLSVSLNHYYAVTSYGFAVLNDSFTFKNNGTSAVQIPSLQVGIPGQVASKVVEVILSSSNQFSLSQSQGVNDSTLYTITPSQASLGAGATSTVALKAFLSSVFNFTKGPFATTAPVLVLVSPSLNVNVTLFRSTLTLPAGATFTPAPSGFTASASGTSSASYNMTQTSIRPQSSARYYNFTESNQSAFSPIAVSKLVRTIVPSANGYPMVRDEFSVRNLASYNVAQIRLHLLASGLSTAKVVPNTEPPLLSPQVVPISGGILVFTSTSLASPLLPNSNVSLAISYPLPSSMMTLSGSSVTLTIPYTPLIAAPLSNYSIVLAPAKGIVPSGQTNSPGKTVTPLTTGSATLAYTVSLGWAADQAVPAAALVFAVAFATFAIQRPTTAKKEEEGERAVRRISDVIKAFEEKTSLETQYMGELAAATKGSISRTEFERMRNEVNELRSRALQRLTEMKQDLRSGKQYDNLTRVAEAEKEEDRAFRDLLNLFQQYHGSRMNEETFRRLQPNYRKRVESAINHLSDLLHETQTEEK